MRPLWSRRTSPRRQKPQPRAESRATRHQDTRPPPRQSPRLAANIPVAMRSDATRCDETDRDHNKGCDDRTRDDQPLPSRHDFSLSVSLPLLFTVTPTRCPKAPCLPTFFLFFCHPAFSLSRECGWWSGRSRVCFRCLSAFVTCCMLNLESTSQPSSDPQQATQSPPEVWLVSLVPISAHAV